MKILITGICGFVGSTLARALLESVENVQIRAWTISSAGQRIEPARTLAKLGVKIIHADVRSATDFETLPAADFVIDAAANPSVLAGVDGKTSSRQLLEHNLWGTVNLLEYCKAHRAGFDFVEHQPRVFRAAARGAAGGSRSARVPSQIRREIAGGIDRRGVSEKFSTAPPISLYGSSKLASETIALEYAETFNFPVWINRCGVLAGAGQFGKAGPGHFFSSGSIRICAGGR
jgi:CDP-paratose 2-epimerase